MEYKSRKKQYIGHEGFMKTTIKKVVINGTVYLDSHVFYQCQNLETVVLNGTITNKFPENYHPPVSGGRGWLFDECTKLKNVIINGTIETGLDTITSVTVPASIASLGTDVFGNCQNITTITIHNKFKSVSDFYPAFSDCRNLQTINFHGTQKEWERLMATANEWEAAKLQNVTVNIIPQ